MAACEILISILDTVTGQSRVESFYTSPITVGSDASNTLRIDNHQVAPHHAEITFTVRAVVLRSFVGKGRTILNGTPVRASSAVGVEDGAVVMLGPVRLTVLQGAEMLALQTWPKDGESPRLGLGLALSLAEPDPIADSGDEAADTDRTLRRANELLLTFIAALIMARHYLPISVSGDLGHFRDPVEAMAYLTDLAASGRVQELGDDLTELVTTIAKLSTPTERWPA